eukprot:5096017-Amphidinium_carterae.1
MPPPQPKNWQGHRGSGNLDSRSVCDSRTPPRSRKARPRLGPNMSVHHALPSEVVPGSTGVGKTKCHPSHWPETYICLAS